METSGTTTMAKRLKMGEFSLTVRRYKCGCYYRDEDESVRIVHHCDYHRVVLEHLRKQVAQIKTERKVQ